MTAINHDKIMMFSTCRTKPGRLIQLATALLPLLLQHNAMAQNHRPYSIQHYAAEVQADINSSSLTGAVTLQFSLPRTPAEPRQAQSPTLLELSVGELQIDSLTLDGLAIQAQRHEQTLRIDLSQLHQGSTTDTRLHSLSLRYHGKPAKGMYFLPSKQQIYTSFDTGAWLPCVDAPDSRASLELSLRLPASFAVVANGELQAEHEHGDGSKTSQWRQNQALPCYLYGFAAGKFKEVRQQAGATHLRFLSPPDFSDTEIATIFQETQAMLEFYQDKSGIPYPASTYTQVLVSAAAAQEVDGFAIMSEKYARRVLENPSHVWLIAHELSHQWWGNYVTNQAWTEFWLNEGIASFLNAAFLEHRYGKARYDKQIQATLASYNDLKARGADKPLVFSSWTSPGADDRAIAYDKGAYVMHVLRAELGETAFWQGLRNYTRKHWGQAVTSQDLQQAMEAASQRDLSHFFASWVYPVPKSSPQQP